MEAAGKYIVLISVSIVVFLLTWWLPTYQMRKAKRVEIPNPGLDEWLVEASKVSAHVSDMNTRELIIKGTALQSGILTNLHSDALDMFKYFKLVSAVIAALFAALVVDNIFFPD